MIFHIFLVACSSPQKDTSTSNNSNEPTVEPSYEDSGFAHTVPFNGTVAYEDGTEVTSANTRVQMCSEYCYPAMIGSDGNFAFAGLPVSKYAFDVVPLGDNADNYTTPLDMITLTEEMDSYSLAVSVKVPTFSSSQDLTQTEIIINEELFISVDSTTFTAREGFESKEYVAGGTIPENSGLLLEGISGELIKGWYLGAFESKVGDWEFRVENLEPGITLHAYNSSYESKEWISLGTATVDENGVFLSPNGLKILSGIILMKE
jgi:hypothetical protein